LYAFLVIRVTNTATFRTPFIMRTPNDQYWFYILNGDTLGYVKQSNNGGTANVNGSVAITEGSTILLSIEHDGTTMNVYQNESTLLVTGAADVNSMDILANMRIGASMDGSWPFNGDMAALLFYNEDVSVSNRALIKNFLNTKYEIY